MIRCFAAFLLLGSCAQDPQPASDSRNEAPEAAAVAQPLRSLPPDAYLRPQDRERARRDDPRDPPCRLRYMASGEPVESSLPIDRCYRLLPSRRFRGIWFNAREGSVFWPDRVAVPREEPQIWLDVERVSLRTARGERAYLVDFEGRQTIYPWVYGAGFPHAIVVDRVRSAVPVE